MAERVGASVAPQLAAMQEAITRHIAPMLEAQQRAIEQSIAPFVQAHADAISEFVTANQEHIASLTRAAEQFSESFRRDWQEAIPPNIRALEDNGGLFEAIDMSVAAGPCVIWAPRAEIVEQLVAAETFDERSAILVERREDVLSDLADVLAESGCEVVAAQTDARELASLAVEAAKDKHDAAAQALAAATLACVLQEVLLYEGLGGVYKAMSRHDIEDATFQILRVVAIELATSQTLLNTDEHVAGFNRHGTLHGKRSFYGPGEMLAALLLVVAWVRELSWWAEKRPSVFDTDAGLSGPDPD
jgi:hypothetical protein